MKWEKKLLRIGNKKLLLTPFFRSALGIFGQKRDRLENLPHIFLYEYYREFGSTFITLSTVKCTSVSVSDGWTKTQNLKEFRTTRIIRLDMLIALSTCSRRLNKHEDLRHLVQQLPTSPKAISKQHSRKQSYLHQKPGGIAEFKYILPFTYVTKKKKKFFLKVTQRALHIFTNATASQPGLPDNSNCHARLKQQSPGKMFKHHKRELIKMML